MDVNKKQEQLEQKLLLAKLEDKIEECLTKNKVVATSFLDMAQKALVEKQIHSYASQPIAFLLTGGYTEAQRQLLIIYPEKLQPHIQAEDLTRQCISCLRMKLPKEQQGSYTHQQYLRSTDEIRNQKRKGRRYFSG
ncbi:MAG: hypothetical protein ACLU84_08875 [Clostridia bacterium]